MKRRAPKGLDEQEVRLSKLLFNKSENLVEKLSTHEDGEEDSHRKPVWVDEDDQNFKANIIPNIESKELYTEKLKQKYKTLMGTPKWAKLQEKPKIAEEQEGDDKILRTVGHLHKEKRLKGLKKDFLDVAQFSNLNAKTRNEGPIISCIEFHPKSSVGLVAGKAGIVSLFSVGRRGNNLLHNFKLKNWNISTADIAPSGNEAYISSKNKKTYCIYDLIKAEPQLVQLPKNIAQPVVFKLSPDGNYIAISDNFDEVFILSTGSKELLRVLKHNSNVKSLTFSHNSKQLYSYGVQGEVTIWDLSTYRSVQKFYDQGCVTASYITTSSCGRLLATGSGEGIVNIYQTENLNCAEPLPLKTITNMTTKITKLKFNPTTEILGIVSSMYPNALKFVHIPTYRVYMNFPKQNFNLDQVDVVSFSPNSGFLGIGNNKGNAFLYRLNYYKNY